MSDDGTPLETKDNSPYGLQLPGRHTANGTPAQEDFTGHERDAATGLLYAGARYYMPALGRWTTTDPLADEYPSLSPYNYGANNPTNIVDPNGMWAYADESASGLLPFGNDEDLFSDMSRDQALHHEQSQMWPRGMGSNYFAGGADDCPDCVNPDDPVQLPKVTVTGKDKSGLMRSIVKQGPDVLDVVAADAGYAAIGLSLFSIMTGPEGTDAATVPAAATMALISVGAETSALFLSTADYALYDGDLHGPLMRAGLLVIAVGSGRYVVEGAESTIQKSLLTPAEKRATRTGLSGAGGASAAGTIKAMDDDTP